MTQAFSRRGELGVKAALLAVCVLVLALGAWAVSLNRSSQDTGEPVPQPIAFSHKHHAGDDGIDCRYCHTSVETSAYAGLPSTHICLSCHSQLYTDAAVLQPLRESARTGEPIAWQRVHSLPDFVYFNHSVHVKKGVGCSTCHGRVDRMPLMRQEAPLQMGWCLDCHKNPAKYVRPRELVTQMDYVPPANQMEVGERLVKAYQIQSLTSCSTCHR